MRKFKNKKSNNPKLKRPNFIKKGNVVDYLSEDESEPAIKNQKFVCLSFCSIQGRQKDEAILNICKENGFNYEQAKIIIDKWCEFSDPKRAIKVRGSYAQYDEADARCKKLRRVHKNHHVYVGEVGFWGPFDPDPSKVTNQNYFEQELNELKEGYERNRLMKEEHYEDRKRELVRKARLEGTKWGQEYLMKKGEPLQAVQERIKGAEEQIAQYADKIKEAENAKELALQKLEYMNANPHLIEQAEPEDLMDVAPEEIKRQVAQGINTTVLEELEAVKNIDDQRNVVQLEQQKKPSNVQSEARLIQEIVEENEREAGDKLEANFKPTKDYGSIFGSGETFGDELLLPYQQREKIVQFDEEYRKQNPNFEEEFKKLNTEDESEAPTREVKSI